MMDDDHGRLAARAQQARASLQSEERHHSVPPAPVQGGRRGRRHGYAPAFAGLLVAAVAVGLVIGGLWRDRSLVGPDAITSVSAGSRPVIVVADGTTVFVADEGPGAVIAYDAQTLKPRWISHAVSRPVSLALDGSRLWVLDTTNRHLYALDPGDGRVIGDGGTSLGATDLATSAGLVWVLAADNRTIDKYDAASVRQIGSVSVPAGVTTISSSADALWVSAGRQVLRVSLDATRDTGVLSIPVPGEAIDVVADSRTAWVALAGGELLRMDAVDPSTSPTRFATDSPPTCLALLDDGSVVVGTSSGSLQRVRLDGSKSSLPSPGAPLASLDATGSLIVGVSPTTAQLYATEVPR